MLRYLVPLIRLVDLPPMLLAAALGALLAGAYGVIHDQITFSISPEYFRKLKYAQFHYADFGFSERVFVAEIGWLATWWVGLITAWLLARRLIPNQPRARAWRQIRAGFAIVFACALAAGLLGSAYGLLLGPKADYSFWSRQFLLLKIDDRWAFVRVAYIHNAGYLGGLIGLIVALALLRPKIQSATTDSARSNPPILAKKKVPEND